MAQDCGIEARVTELALEVEALKRRVNELSAGLQASPLPASPLLHSPSETVDAGEELVSWMGRSSLLPRISTACFLLVVSLILRTITDNELIDKQVGSLLGMTYAAALIFASWFLYARPHPLAPVFAVCGAFLMYSIVVETHAHFGSLPSVPAYAILMVSGVGLATISYAHQSAVPVLAGTLGMGIAGIAIDYPSPYFPHLALVLLVANLLGAFATRLQRCSWLRWILLLITSAMLLAWGVKLSLKVTRAEVDLAQAGFSLYLPVVALFALIFLGIALWAAFRRGGEGPITRFDLMLPSVNALWAFPAAWVLMRVWWESSFWLGMLGIALAGVHLGIAWGLRKRLGERSAEITAYVWGAVVWLILSGPVVGGVLAALSLPALAALGLSWLAQRWRIGAIRGLSYLLQGGAALALGALCVTDGPVSPALQGAVSAIVSGGALAHFVWCRSHPFQGDSRFFGRWDPEDRSAAVLLMSALFAGFFLCDAILRPGVSGMPEPVAALQGAKTAVINGVAAVLALLAYYRRSRELRNMAILVGVVGAGRVFVFDLFRISAVPLVGSVLSFGLAIFLLSFVLTRWPRREEGMGAAAAHAEEVFSDS